MARATILDQTLDQFHSAHPKRRRSRDLEEFHSTARTHSLTRYNTKPPTPSPPSNVMPLDSMYDVRDHDADLDDPSSSPTPARHAPPADFFGRHRDSLVPPLPEAETDDRLEEVVHQVSTGLNRESAASTMTVGHSPIDNNPIEGEDSDDEETDEDPQNIQPPPSTQAKSAQAQKPGSRSMEFIDDSEDEEEQKATHPPPSTQAKKSTPKKSRPRNRELVEKPRDKEEMIIPKKKLRERTVAQEHPYGFDKARHNMSTKKGREVDDSEVEFELKLTQRKAAKPKKRARTSPKAQAQSKKGRNPTGRFASVETGRSTPSSVAGTLDFNRDIELREERILQSTTLNIWMQGDDDGANAIQLAQCPTLTALFDHIDDTWGKVSGKKATKVKCMLPWMDEKTSLVMYRDWDTSFQKMLRNIHKAPLWWKTGEAELDVELVVTMG